MIRRNVDLIAIGFLLTFLLTGAAARRFHPASTHVRYIQPRVMEIRDEARNELMRTRDEVRDEVREAIREAAEAVRQLRY